MVLKEPRTRETNSSTSYAHATYSYNNRFLFWPQTIGIGLFMLGIAILVLGCVFGINRDLFVDHVNTFFAGYIFTIIAFGVCLGLGLMIGWGSDFDPTAGLYVAGFGIMIAALCVGGADKMTSEHVQNDFAQTVVKDYEKEHHITGVEASYKGLYTLKNKPTVVYKVMNDEMKSELIAYSGHGNTAESHQKITKEQFSTLEDMKEKKD